MGNSKIEYCDKTWNVTSGCTKVSAGCTNCWAERAFPRIYRSNKIENYIKNENPLEQNHNHGMRLRKFTDIKLHRDKLDEPLHWKKPQKIFVNSMSDLFHEDVPFEFIDKVYQVMQQCEHHAFQILTKRPDRLYEYCEVKQRGTWPENIWPGASIENQKTADERIPILLQIPAKVHWLSIEPMLEEITVRHQYDDYLQGWIADHDPCDPHTNGVCTTCPIQIQTEKIDWVVVGAESGPKRRECKIEWIESIVEQCKSANVPVFVKQIHLNGKLEKDINNFPISLQVREFPGG